MCALLDAAHERCLIEAGIVDDILDGASAVAACTDGEGALQNVMMLHVGHKYRDAFGFDRVVRGNGGELLKLSRAYAFALPAESRDDAGAARIEMLHETFDRASLAGGVAPLEQDDDFFAGLLDPFLHLQQFHLQASFFRLVIAASDLVGVGVHSAFETANDFHAVDFVPGDALVLERRCFECRFVAAFRNCWRVRGSGVVHVICTGL